MARALLTEVTFLTSTSEERPNIVGMSFIFFDIIRTTGSMRPGITLTLARVDIRLSSILSPPSRPRKIYIYNSWPRLAPTL